MALVPGAPLDIQLPDYHNPQGLGRPGPEPDPWPGDLPTPSDSRLTSSDLKAMRKEVVEAIKDDPVKGRLYRPDLPERLRTTYNENGAANPLGDTAAYYKGGPVIRPTSKTSGLHHTVMFAHGGDVINSNHGQYSKEKK